MLPNGSSLRRSGQQSTWLTSMGGTRMIQMRTLLSGKLYINMGLGISRKQFLSNLFLGWSQAFSFAYFSSNIKGA